MSNDAGTARDAAERNAEAIATGNLNQVLADITPEVLQKLMLMGAQLGKELGVQPGTMTPGAMPKIEQYSVTPAGMSGEDERFETTFSAANGTATIATAWRLIVGQWKIVDVEVLQMERFAEDDAQEVPGD